MEPIEACERFDRGGRAQQGGAPDSSQDAQIETTPEGTLLERREFNCASEILDVV